jgi:hypothetical protein
MLLGCTIVKHVRVGVCFPSEAQKCEPFGITMNYNKSWNGGLFSNINVIVGNVP